MRLPAGTHLGRYEIVAALGAGGMGEVYRAHDHRLERDVAAKILAVEYDNPRRFEQEAKALAALNHPNVLAIYEFGEQDGSPYLISELVEGATLREVMNRQMPLRQIVDIVAQICDGLGAAHSIGIAHRDLKPENVMLTRERVAKILDFGLARRKRVPSPHEATLTARGIVAGTIGYLAPEQAIGEEAGPLADIFSVGVLLYEMLSGKQPFLRATVAESMTATIREDPEPLPENVSSVLIQIVMRCLEKPCAKRFQSVVDLGFALRSLTTGTSRPSQSVEDTPASNKSSTRWVWVVLALVAGFEIWHALSGPETFPTSTARVNAFASAPEMEAFPEFSPDGKFVAYFQSDARSNNRFQLLVRPLIGGSPSEPLAETDGGVGRPVWASDGNRILYAGNNGSIWSVAPSGGEPQLMIQQGGPFTLSPDGKHLLLAKLDGTKKWQILDSSPPGSEPKPILELPVDANNRVFIGRFSPDGAKYLMLEKDRNSNLDMVWLIPFPHGTPKREMKLSGIFPTAMAWYPDSRHFVIATDSSDQRYKEIRVGRIGKGEPSQLLLSSPDPIVSLALSPDGRELIYSAGPVNWDAVDYDLDTEKSVRMGETRVYDYACNYSADGAQLLWASNVGPKVVLKTRSKHGDRVLLEHSASNGVQFSARLSPDGRRVAYLDGGYLWVSAGAGKPVRLAELVGVSGPCWSADGKHLAYMRQDGPKRYLERIPSSGGEAKRLTEAVGSTCAWSPDGKWIAQLGAQLRFTDTSSGTTNAVEGYQARGGAFNKKGELYAATRDAVSVLEVPSGREIVRTRAPLLASSSGTVAVHPSGRRIAYSEGTYGYDLWMMDMPQPTTGVRHFWRKWTLPAKPVASEAVLE